MPNSQFKYQSLEITPETEVHIEHDGVDEKTILCHYELWKLLSPVEANSRSFYSDELLTHLKYCADSGKWSECEYELAQYYEVVDKKMDEAVRYYLSSEEKNNVEAKYRVWQLIQEGVIMKESPGNQMVRCEFLSSKGKADCQYELALLYYQQDRFEDCFKCFKLAADQGHADAQYEVGRGYLGDFIVKESIPDALMYFKRAAHQGHITAAHHLGCWYIFEDGDHSPDALFYFQLAAGFGDDWCQSVVSRWSYK